MGTVAFAAVDFTTRSSTALAQFNSGIAAPLLHEAIAYAAAHGA